MALKLEHKQAIVAEVNEAAGKALSAVLADYRGLTVSQMTELRAKARASGVYMRVIRNTLAKRAVAGNGTRMPASRRSSVRLSSHFLRRTLARRRVC